MKSKEKEAVRHIIQLYIDGSYLGNVEALEKIFHPKAIMSGYLQGQLGIGSPEPFFETVANNPSAKKTGASYSTEIASIETAGNVACVTLIEKGFLGMDFTNYFHLIKENGKWSIISKTFNQG